MLTKSTSVQQQQPQSLRGGRPGEGTTRFDAAAADMASHVSGKVLAALRQPEYAAQLTSLLDPVVNHIIQRVFPYIILSCVLFLILLALTVLTFLMVIRGGGGASHGSPMTPSFEYVPASGGG